MLSRRGLMRWALGTPPAALVAGCGGAPAAGNEPRPAARLGPLTIDVVTRNGVTAATGHSQWYDHAAKTTFTPETGVTVNLIDGLPSVTEKLTVLASAGTPPDGSWFPTMSDGSGGRELAQKGVFKPLDDLIKRDSRFDLKPYFPTLLDLCRFGGKTFGLTTMAHYGTNVLYYNKARWQGAGVTIPADGSMTVDEFVAAGQKVVNKAQDLWAYWPVLGMDQWGVFWIRQFGGEVLDEAGKRVLLDTPEARAGLEWVYNCQARFQLIDDLFRTDGQDPMFETSGKLAARSQTPGLVSEYKKPGQERVKFDLGIAIFPRGPKGNGTQGLGAGMGMTRLEHQAAVWEWIKFITNKENGVAQVFGGAGSPGGRTDSWTDPRLAAVDPIYATMQKVHPRGPGSIRWPANNRRVDLIKALDENLTPYFKGQTSLNDATAKAVAAGNAVLSL
jgi:ABC-type glycerol-3-phosphate transport system substrate-binding protein